VYLPMYPRVFRLFESGFFRSDLRFYRVNEVPRVRARGIFRHIVPHASDDNVSRSTADSAVTTYVRGLLLFFVLHGETIR
jgi:hypothetical protein